MTHDERSVILLVDDENAVRTLLGTALRTKGYCVLEARDGPDALAQAAETDRIDLVLTDVLLPTMRGPALVRELRKRFPELKSLFMSGANAGVVEREGGSEEDAFLAKPFSLVELLDKIQEELEG